MHDEEAVIAIAGMFFVFGIPLVWIVVHYGYLACKHWQATRLIREMVARGYNAQEIVQVCQALGHKKDRSCGEFPDVPPAKPIRHPAYG